MRALHAALVAAIALIHLEALVELPQSLREPRRWQCLSQLGQACQAGVDLHFAIVEEARIAVAARAGGGWRNRPQVIARGSRPLSAGLAPPYLRLLLAPALARNLHIGAAEHGVPCSDRNGHVGRRRARNPLAGDVVVKARRRPLAGGVVEDACAGDARKRRARIDGQRLPGLQPSLNCSGKTLGSPAALKTSCAISPETWCWP